MDEQIYYIWLSMVCGAGSIVPSRLFKYYSSAIDIYVATEEELTAKTELELKRADIIRLCDKNINRAKLALDYCIKNSIDIRTCHDDNYPARLRAIQNYPVVLYIKGDLIDIDDNVCIAVVGTRKYTPYGEYCAFCMARGISAGGGIIVSGMAKGIDAFAHRGASSRGGYNIAVFGCGIDRVYPSENADVMRMIVANGAAITEFPPGTTPAGTNFPIRNRIISGLCQGTLVVEADEQSGSLITANTAKLQGREIYAIPGAIGLPTSAGSNKLIKMGAHCVTTPFDILNEYELLYSHRINLKNIPDINADIQKYKEYLEKQKKSAENKQMQNVSAEQRVQVAPVAQTAPPPAAPPAPIPTVHSAVAPVPIKPAEVAASPKPLAEELDAVNTPLIAERKHHGPQEASFVTQFRNEAKAIAKARELEKARKAENALTVDKLSIVEQRIYMHLQEYECSATDLVELGIDSGHVVGALSVLEIMELIEPCGDGLYRAT